MNYISVENIAKSYGERVLFEDISFGINKGQKIAFVAKNGTGKTSILNLLVGKDSPDKGQIVMRKDLDIGFLAQDDDLNPEFTIEECIFSADNKILAIIHQYEKALENPEDSASYQEAFELMEQHNAWDFETQYKQILSKLQLEDLSLQVKHLSGGQRKRLALALILINTPDILILDEPTNHLDLEMIEWLESFFAKEKLTLFMVTHDRYFLERVCNEIIELDQGKLYSYKGNYSYYLTNKEERLAIEQTELGKTKNLYKKELDWMRRQPKARTTKSKSRIEDFHEIKKRAHQRRENHEIQLEINMERLGSKIVELHHISKAFGDKIILDKFHYVFKRGERIGLIGKNGTGKSTFLNLLTGKLPVDSGKVVIGETVKFGYYTQAGIEIKPGQKVIEVIKEFGEYIPLTKGRKISAGQLLERFLFDRKKQYDYVEKLSGGEQKRLYLCTVLIQNPNFLILDEPTNDLDILTLNVLEQFLMDYPGNLLIVSHDRYFMDKIVDHLFILNTDGHIKDFPGNYSDYRAYDNQQIKPVEVKQAVTQAPKEKKKLSYTESKEFEKLELDIASLEEQKKSLELQFTNEELSPEKVAKLSEELQSIIHSIERKEERWLEISMKLDQD
ncbi:ABC-F family ATP-binding cassette domain-containing protein [Flavobacteriaceae bacterium F08102]|nr:ABC-F family ATP-binding cassette domain-containing protein [Flavobacteriaceae bacterium F08102]